MTPPRLRWKRFEHILTETSPGVFEVRTPGGKRIGWVTRIGVRFDARGEAQSVRSSSSLGGGPYYSGRAALVRVIGAHEVEELSRAVRARVAELETQEVKKQRIPAIYGPGIKRASRHS